MKKEVEVKKEEWSGLAVGSFIFSFLFFIPNLGLVASIISIFLGIYALIKRDNKRGKGLAIVGIIISSIILYYCFNR